ncbi:KpsF/GutQ family sugar-phosphate isomerase [Insolitispirillum peregrinum]
MTSDAPRLSDSLPTVPPVPDDAFSAAEQEVILTSARNTLALEATALTTMAAELGREFLAALALMERAQGRVVVSGMGKSGHIGTKIAATLASTGTPSLFVHPAEASHGDLGMVTTQDVVLAISNSGETSELSDIIAFTRRFAIPLVAITSRAGSTLAQAADVALVLPAVAEACPHGLAPTTSTTATLALGDALAVALLERRGFSASDFRLFHPGGKLGKRLQKVADLMHGAEALPLCAPTVTMAEALLVMTSKSFGCVGVVENDQLVGIITDGDLRRHMAPDLPGKAVGAVMTRGPKSVTPTLMAAEALHIMNASKVTSLFVVENGKPVGILHIHDLLRAGLV